MQVFLGEVKVHILVPPHQVKEQISCWLAVMKGRLPGSTELSDPKLKRILTLYFKKHTDERQKITLL